MAYIIEAEMEQRFGTTEISQLKDGDVDRVDNAIADADALIDSYLINRYDIPLDPVPDIIKQRSGDIARYYLYDDDVPDAVRTRYEDAISWLKLISKGVTSLPIDEEEVGTAGVIVKTRSQRFTDEMFDKMPDGKDDLGL